MSKNFKKMLSYYKPYRGIFWADMFFATVSAAVALAIPLVIRYVTYTLVYEDKAQIMYQIKIIAAALFAMVVADCYSKFFISNYGHVMGAKIEYNMRAEIFEHLQKLSFSFYDNQKVGQLMSRITTDLFDITELMHHGPENIILSAIKIIGAFVILVNISPLLALAAFIVLPFMFAYAYYLNGKMRRAFRQNRVKIAEINGQIEDNLSGIRVVKSFANEEIEKKKFKIGNAGFLSAKKNSYHYMGSFQAGLGAFTTLIQVNVILAGTILIANGKVNVSDLVTFVLYISVFTDPVRTLIDFTEQFQNGYSGFERFCEIMEIEPDIKDRADAKELTDVRGDITFEDVSFQYEENTEQVLQHINLTVPAGSYMALVGASGAGKSTLCSLIPRFYDVTEGAVKVDGTDVRDLTLKSLRDHIGIVQQDVKDTSKVHVAVGDVEALLPRREQVPGERYRHGERIRVYVVNVARGLKGPEIVVSRSHPELVRRLFEREVPELVSGAVSIMAIAREAGARTKIAVRANTEGVNPKGALIGPGGARVRAVMENLGPEKIDIVDWSADPAKFVAAALSPADVKSVTLLPGSTKACRVIVPDDQLSLAIGKEGQNARLAARLTGYKIDIKPASQEQELEAIDAQPDAAPEDAEPQA